MWEYVSTTGPHMMFYFSLCVCDMEVFFFLYTSGHFQFYFFCMINFHCFRIGHYFIEVIQFLIFVYSILSTSFYWFIANLTQKKKKSIISEMCIICFWIGSLLCDFIYQMSVTLVISMFYDAVPTCIFNTFFCYVMSLFFKSSTTGMSCQQRYWLI